MSIINGRGVAGSRKAATGLAPLSNENLGASGPRSTRTFAPASSGRYASSASDAQQVGPATGTSNRGSALAQADNTPAASTGQSHRNGISLNGSDDDIERS
jgi:hypothetical protein